MSKFSILIVDDEKDFLDTLTKRLRRRNFDVQGVTSGEQALEYLTNDPMDIVILDVKMPGMDGISVLREIKRCFPLVEVFMLTGHASLEAAVEGMKLGAFDYLLKPVGLDELLFKMEDAYQKKILQENSKVGGGCVATW
nr:response regulator [Desulfovulcanus ferrireducens]